MGRKIPGKKHRGVKDPEEQRARRLAELENKINAPPKDVDEQALPNSLKKVIRLKEAVKNGRISKNSKKKKTKKKGLICVGADNTKSNNFKGKPDKIVPIFKQNFGENNYHFYHRVCKETDAFLKETAFEKKYGVQVTRNAETGNVEGLTKCAKDEIEEHRKLMLKHKNIKKKKKKKKEAEIDEVKLTKQQKKKQKLQLKKERQQEDKGDFTHLQDKVEFGEVVHAPPQLTVRPKKVESDSCIKTGFKGLLLKSILKQGKASEISPAVSDAIDKCGKRKNLPVGERRQLEKQQHDVILAYKKLKAQRSADTHT